MEIICPVCTKKNELTEGGSESCVRCGGDLSMLRLVLDCAGRYLSEAKAGLEGKNWEAAMAAAERSWNLLHTTESAAVVCVAAAALGEMDVLALWRKRASDG